MSEASSGYLEVQEASCGYLEVQGREGTHCVLVHKGILSLVELDENLISCVLQLSKTERERNGTGDNYKVSLSNVCHLHSVQMCLHNSAAPAGAFAVIHVPVQCQPFTWQ